MGEWPPFSRPSWSQDSIPRGSRPVNGHLSAQMDPGLACEGGGLQFWVVFVKSGAPEYFDT